MLDPYLVLGVGRYDDDQTVKKAYRALSKQYHPDNNINNPNKAAAEETFKKIQIAYEQIMHERSLGIGGPNDPERFMYEEKEPKYNQNSNQYQNQNRYQSQTQSQTQNNQYYNTRTAEKDRTDNSDSWWNNSAFNQNNNSDKNQSGYYNSDFGNNNYYSSNNNSYNQNSNNQNSYNQYNGGYTQSNNGFNQRSTGGYYTGTGSQRNYEYSNSNGYYYSSNFTGSTRTENSNTGNTILDEVAQNINNRDFFKALDILSTINNRTDVWYYYSAVANLGLGNNVTAMYHAKQALNMNPNSVEYNELVRGMESGTLQYQGRADMFKPHNPKAGNICVKLIIANIALNIFCGGSGAVCNGLCAIC